MPVSCVWAAAEIAKAQRRTGKDAAGEAGHFGGMLRMWRVAADQGTRGSRLSARIIIAQAVAKGCSRLGLCGVNILPPSSVTCQSSSRRTPNSPVM